VNRAALRPAGLCAAHRQRRGPAKPLVGSTIVSEASPPEPPAEVTQLLRRWQAGDRAALEHLEPVVHAELRRLAARSLRAERAGHSLQPTELVHEAFLRLFGSGLELADRRHFFALASRTMRRVLVDHARARRRLKRGSGEAFATLDEALAPSEERPEALIQLDEALERLTALDARQAEVVELHYFGGLTYDEAAAVVGVSPATVKRELRSARAWLKRELLGA
jgi:RNA polymerase sigma factor (TIGR02999 family)